MGVEIQQISQIPEITREEYRDTLSTAYKQTPLFTGEEALQHFEDHVLFPALYPELFTDEPIVGESSPLPTRPIDSYRFLLDSALMHLVLKGDQLPEKVHDLRVALGWAAVAPNRELLSRPDATVLLFQPSRHSSRPHLERKFKDDTVAQFHRSAC